MSNATQDPNAFLMGGGGRSAKFEAVGDAITGTITETAVTQQTYIATGAPKTWDNGDPMMQLVVTLQTDERVDEDDDGARKVYLKGGTRNEQSTQGAVAVAVKKSGASGLAVGGRLHLKYVGDGTPKQRGFDAPKLYEAAYKVPEQPVALDSENDPFA